jgi:hypothetical protein
MNPEALAKKLADVKTSKDFTELRLMLQHWSKPELFSVLFAIASDYKTYPWPVYSVATDLLVSLEPPCPSSCRETLVQLGKGHLEASLKRLPFYLVAEFGRSQVLKETEAFLAEPDLDEQTREALTTIKYWVRAPASYLVGGFFHRWEKWDDHAA